MILGINHPFLNQSMILEYWTSSIHLYIGLAINNQNLFTFNLLVLFIPSPKLLALGCWHIGIVCAIYNGWYHTLEAEKEKEFLKRKQTLPRESRHFLHLKKTKQKKTTTITGYTLKFADPKFVSHFDCWYQWVSNWDTSPGVLGQDL